MKEQKKGILFGFIAYIFWGIIPIYWKLLPTVDPLDILCYRIVWSFVFMILYILITRRWSLFLAEVNVVLQDKKKLFAIICAAMLISVNWFTFIYTVSQGHVTQASLGYYINPLVNVLLATLILKEKLSRSGMISCGLALFGVLLLTIQTGEIPYAPLIMAVTFSFYGLIKKGITVSSYTGLTIETVVIMPIAVIYLVFFSRQGFMHYELSTNLLLMGAGIVTAIPLLLFAQAAKQISYIILGFIQYIGPTIMLLSALFLYHEPYSAEQFIAFGFIWLAIAVFTYGNIYTYRKEKRFAK
ncbi:EamA family transporter RarD [Enterococcus plantarum]|uniref:EamA family transporter RarD n=1 Tax=Enterococcus plantarum TaxID=1077675 RepID=A0A2W4BS82_9ENTE|nr:EamA family transporter RarD [Enterococcus plantarum]PZL76029.1 EamA family transporter RarD [Enterococcus plantarum]